MLSQSSLHLHKYIYDTELCYGGFSDSYNNYFLNIFVEQIFDRNVTSLREVHVTVH